jgi:hypothetical protein
MGVAEKPFGVLGRILRLGHKIEIHVAMPRKSGPDKRGLARLSRPKNGQ